jgi:hypothetical protein
MRCPEAARLKWTAGEPLEQSSRGNTAALSVTEKVPEQSGKTDAGCPTKVGASSSYGDPVLVWRRPGGSDPAITVQGSQAYLRLAATLLWR